MTHSHFHTIANTNPNNLPPISQPAEVAKWAKYKADSMMRQWEFQVNLSKGLDHFYGANLAVKQFWPASTGGMYPNLISYLELVLNKQNTITLNDLDSDLINLLRNMNSHEGVVSTKRHQLEVNNQTMMNLDETMKIPNHDRAQEAISTKEACTICTDLLDFNRGNDIVELNNCSHIFHRNCIETWLRTPTSQKICPNCKKPCYNSTSKTTAVGTMPDGEMAYFFSDRLGAWFICYFIPHGTQSSFHPSPGLPFRGTIRTAVCPIYSKWGPLLFIRLVTAFYYRHTFSVGTSLTTNLSDTTIWNGIHHKTCIDGLFGFPDPEYETRVSSELDSKDILVFLHDIIQ
nr:268_t:CDS:1 [Entrophospora candida]CAG8604527.1 13885_t:CDS:1 [Entrophospora candida]